MWKKPEESTASPQPSAPPLPMTPQPTPTAASAGSAASGAPAAAAKDRAAIGASIVVVGDLAGEEDLIIHGRVEGRVDLAQNSVTIGRSGRVQADIFAKNVSVEGEVQGNVYAGEQIVLRKSGSVQGNLVSPRVTLEDGCKFKGAIDMDPRAGERARGAAARPRPSEARPNEARPAEARPAGDHRPEGGKAPIAAASAASGASAASTSHRA